MRRHDDGLGHAVPGDRSAEAGRVFSSQAEREALAHRLRSPLTVAVGRTQLLRRRRHGVEPARVATDLETIEAALVQLTAMVEHLDAREAR